MDFIVNVSSTHTFSPGNSGWFKLPIPNRSVVIVPFTLLSPEKFLADEGFGNVPASPSFGISIISWFRYCIFGIESGINGMRTFYTLKYTFTPPGGVDPTAVFSLLTCNPVQFTDGFPSIFGKVKSRPGLPLFSGR